MQLLDGPRWPEIDTFLLKITLSTYSPENITEIIAMKMDLLAKNNHTRSDKNTVSVFSNFDCSTEAWKVFRNWSGNSKFRLNARKNST
jgi:hypothetical protein